MGKIFNIHGLPIESTLELDKEIVWFREILKKEGLSPKINSNLNKSLNRAYEIAQLSKSNAGGSIDENIVEDMRYLLGVSSLIKTIRRLYSLPEPPEWLNKDLRLFVKGQVPFTMPYKRLAKTDFIWEFIVASRLASFCSVYKQEPDIVCNMRSTKFSIACKMIWTKNKKQWLNTLSVASRQIEKAEGKRGYIAVDYSPIIDHKKYFRFTGTAEQPSYLDFKNKESPTYALDKDLRDIINELKASEIEDRIRYGYSGEYKREKCRAVIFFARTVLTIQGIPATLQRGAYLPLGIMDEFDEVIHRNLDRSQ